MGKGGQEADRGGGGGVQGGRAAPLAARGCGFPAPRPLGCGTAAVGEGWAAGRAPYYVTGPFKGASCPPLRRAAGSGAPAADRSPLVTRWGMRAAPGAPLPRAAPGAPLPQPRASRRRLVALRAPPGSLRGGPGGCGRVAAGWPEPRPESRARLGSRPAASPPKRIAFPLISAPAHPRLQPSCVLRSLTEKPARGDGNLRGPKQGGAGGGRRLLYRLPQVWGARPSAVRPVSMCRW